MKIENRVFFKGVSHIPVLAILLVGFIGTVILPDVSYAQRQRKIRPEWEMPKHYPDGFDGIGYIGRISVDDGEVVINDRLIRLSPYADYYDYSGIISSATFRKGNYVGFVLNSDRHIISMWLFNKGP